MAQARIEIEVLDAREAAAAIDQQTAAITRLETAERKAAGATGAATAAASASRREMRQGAEAAQLLGGQLGIALPRSVNRFIAETKLIGPALTTAFNVAILGAFGFALVGLISKIPELTDAIAGLNEELKGTVKSAQDFSRAMDLAVGIDPQKRVEQFAGEVRRLEKAMAAAESTTSRMVFPFGLLGKAIDTLRPSMVDLRAQLAAAKASLQFYREEVERRTITATKTATEETKKFAAAQRELNDALQITVSEGRLPTLFGTPAAAEIERLRQETEQLGTTVREFPDFSELIGRPAVQAAQMGSEAFERLAAEIDSFFQQVFLTARSFGDVWRQLTQQLVRLFVSAVARMVAAWLLGMRQMQGAAAGGGLLGGILGPLFGGIPGIGPGGTAPTFPAGTAVAGGAGGLSFLGGQSISAGAGALAQPGGAAAGIPGGGGASASILSRLGFTGGGLGLLGAGGLALGALGVGLGFSRGSPGLGAGLGALGGFLAFGPIGAAIGALIGGIAGIFGRGKIRRRAATAQDEVALAMFQIKEDFKLFKLDYDSALQGIQQLWEDFQQATKGLGKYGRRARTYIGGVWMPQMLKEINAIQDARLARGQLLAALPIPEFQKGGLVGQTFLSAFQTIQSGQGKILAFLHGGEAVLNAGAVQRLGPQFIEQANRAPGFQAGGFAGERPARSDLRPVFNIQVVQQPGESSDALVRRLIRELNRRAKDRGLGRVV